ncbi:MAG: MogA/MoaB family molybdenum cofactor biosynthesis protein [Chloroflexales bacterium]|nr:MogA/MoaB family molybdenum cofactor biosynthesis protein [Chloroflexales bacterium]
MGHQQHQQLAHAADLGTIRCGVITISDSRTVENDTSGAAIRDALAQAGHTVLRYEIVRDEPAQITTLIRELEAAGSQVILTNGGTGIARRDSTFEAVDGMLEKRLPGFGELFRMLSYADIGAGAMLSRATAGSYGNTLVFCLPGATDAVRLALEKLILPELEHLVWETVRQR